MELKTCILDGLVVMEYNLLAALVLHAWRNVL